MKANSIITPREIEIVKLICIGMSDGEMATTLNLSPATVRTHRKSILKKLSIKKTILLVRIALDNNWI